MRCGRREFRCLESSTCLGRTGFRRNFALAGEWRGLPFAAKQLEVTAIEEAGDWLAITVIVKYY